ncbi:four-helix bundle copper-binding protein [Nonomuraea terrae]|uniref:Four-helix bundle copper-binding protein n=1 Tax=Nonomuraea terrae TaxID=2530383 RepID=A0A4R4ZCR5_9ACTN|nr:four-helix bundle copper-binding protein [Nonomuraea terrae]TDD54122.1 four-helix bundle copper-binding protein [Nonomuraea terrae]
MPVREMIDTYPADINLDRGQIADTVQALLDCAQACTACADACLSEQEIDRLRKCIRTDLDCADICEATARVLSRHTGYDANITRAQLQACIQACTSCAEECERHAGMHEHCRLCAQACRGCASDCRRLLDAIS